MEVGCECGAGLVEEVGVRAADELVGAVFGGDLEGEEGGADGKGVGSEGAWVGQWVVSWLGRRRGIGE